MEENISLGITFSQPSLKIFTKLNQNQFRSKTVCTSNISSPSLSSSSSASSDSNFPSSPSISFSNYSPRCHLHLQSHQQLHKCGHCSGKSVTCEHLFNKHNESQIKIISPNNQAVSQSSTKLIYLPSDLYLSNQSLSKLPSSVSSSPCFSSTSSSSYTTSPSATTAASASSDLFVNHFYSAKLNLNQLNETVNDFEELIKIRTLLQNLDSNRYKPRLNFSLREPKIKLKSANKLDSTQSQSKSFKPAKSPTRLSTSSKTSLSKLITFKSPSSKSKSYSKISNVNVISLNQIPTFTNIETKLTPFGTLQKFKKCTPDSFLKSEDNNISNIESKSKLVKEAILVTKSSSDLKQVDLLQSLKNNSLVNMHSISCHSQTLSDINNDNMNSQKSGKWDLNLTREVKLNKPSHGLIKSKSLTLTSFGANTEVKRSNFKRPKSWSNCLNHTLSNDQAFKSHFAASSIGLGDNEKVKASLNQPSPLLVEPSLTVSDDINYDSLTNLTNTFEASDSLFQSSIQDSSTFSYQTNQPVIIIDDLILNAQPKKENESNQSLKTNEKIDNVDIINSKPLTDSTNNFCPSFEKSNNGHPLPDLNSQSINPMLYYHQRKTSLPEPSQANLEVQACRQKRINSSVIPLTCEESSGLVSTASRVYKSLFRSYISRYSGSNDKVEQESVNLVQNCDQYSEPGIYLNRSNEQLNTFPRSFRYSKKRLRGPYGEMLEEEMRKSSLNEKQDKFQTHFRFLQDLMDTEKLSEKDLNDAKNRYSFSSAKSDSVTEISNADHSLTSHNRSSSLESSLVNSVRKGCQSNREDILSKSGWSEKCENGKPLRTTLISKKEDARTHIVGELYDTERSYVESLQILVNKYMKPLKIGEYSNLIEGNLVDEVFYQIPEILGHHESFLETLRDRLSNWDSKQKVGDVFVDSFTQKPIIGTYTAFIDNWKNANEAIKLAVQAKPAFAKYLENMSREHKGKLTLDAILIMPVQRIPRYELLIKELLKHTNANHPDYQLLLTAQKEVHELALKINRIEREALQHEQMVQKVKEIENFIEGVIDLSSTDRTFLRYDFVTIPGGLGIKKERCLFLFSDLLIITTIKKKSGGTRKFTSSSSSPSPSNSLDGNKYKLLMRFALVNIDIAKDNDNHFKKTMKEFESLKEDMSTLNQVIDLISNLKCSHQQLDEVAKDLNNSLSKHFNEKQTSDSNLFSLELTITTPESIDNLTIIFTSTEKRLSWESTFNDAKKRLSLSPDHRTKPEFVLSLPIRKTRAGLQISCASSTLGYNHFGFKDVWICNSDGYVGQVCVLSLQPSPTVTSCNGVCNARILCATAIPALPANLYDQTNNKPTCTPQEAVFNNQLISESNETSNIDTSSVATNQTCGGSISSTSPTSTSSFPTALRSEAINSSSASKYSTSTAALKSISLNQHPSNQFQLDSDSSDDEDDSLAEETETLSIPSEVSQTLSDSIDSENNQPTMWLGTEDGCIYVYNCNENIRIRKNKLKVQLSATVNSIIYLDNNIFAALSNGQLAVFQRDSNGSWPTKEPKVFTIATSPVLKLLSVASKLWCSVQNQIKIFSTSSMSIENSFQVTSNPDRPVLCMVNSGLAVWISVKGSSIVKLYHGISYECLVEVDVSPTVNKMLETCDDIIRQHKSACLRITALLACKDLLWIGTSAGAILTLPLPHVSSSTTSLNYCPIVSGIPHGHTGHVRILTTVEINSSQSLSETSCSNSDQVHHSNLKQSKRFLKSRKAVSPQSSKVTVISGGDGHEMFTNLKQNESVGRDDSTNHLLLWQM